MTAFTLLDAVPPMLAAVPAGTHVPAGGGIVARDVSRSFVTGEVRATVLDGLSLTVRPGELTLIVGPSGSGKSTLLAILSGLLRPDAGLVAIDGVDLWAQDDAAINRFRLARCGFVFQGFNLFPALTALEQVLLPLQHLGLTAKDALDRARQALAEVGLEGRAGLRPQALSGGEKQRVAIARAIAKQPQLLFADEPTSALDSRNGQLVIDILHRISRAHGATVLGVTHDPRLLGHADRVVRLEDGRIMADEQTSTFRSGTPGETR